MRITTEDRKVYMLGAWVFGLFAVLLAFGALWVAGDAMNTSDDAKAVAALGGAGGASASLTEFKIDPSMLDVSKDGSITVTNDGKVDHNLALKGTDKKTKMLKPGERAVLDLEGLEDGNYTMYCQVPGHEGAGMKGTVMLGTMGDAGQELGTAGGTEQQLRSTNDELDLAQKKPVDAFVAQLEKGPNTKGVGNQPLAPKVLADGTKEFDLTAKVVDWEVEPGKTVKAWAYGPSGTDNFQVPGPLLEVAVNDKVRVVLDNQLPQSTEIHFHGLQTPFDQDGVPYVTNDGPIKPGKTRAYEFVAKGPAVVMYHSHHHAEHQVPDGLMGVMLVGEMPIPAGYGPVTQELPMVLNDAGAIGLSLNGKSFPATAPIITSPNQTVEIHYYNEGLQIHPMHLHGVNQLVIAKDGNPLPQPYEADVVNVAPGERWTVLVKARDDQKGIWAYHCHILNHAERDDGMFGMVTTLIVQ